MKDDEYYFEFVMWLQALDIYLPPNYIATLYPYWLSGYTIIADEQNGNKELRVLHKPIDYCEMWGWK